MAVINLGVVILDNTLFDDNILGLLICKTENQAHIHLVHLLDLTIHHQNCITIIRARGVPTIFFTGTVWSDISRGIEEERCYNQ